MNNNNSNIDKNQEIIEKILSFSTRIISIMLSTLGTSGTIFVVLVYFIFKWANTEQKQQIINKYILFETSNNCSNGLITIFVILMLIVLMQRNYFIKRIKILKGEIERCSFEKKELQNRYRVFNSSKR